MPFAVVNVYGPYLPQQIVEMHNPKDGFQIKGWTADAKKVMENSRVNLAPLRFGAGIKGKLLLGMQTGTPSVTTPIGAEGMHDGLPWGGFIERTAEQIAQKAVKLYNEENSWKHAQETGFNVLNSIYNKDFHLENLEKRLSAILQHIKQHRIDNFIGGLLQYEGYQATKFMAKWIEAKSPK